MRWMAHFLPFQRSARAVLVEKLGAEVPPTAVHALADVQDTLLRKPGPGPRWTVHFLPFHAFATGTDRAALPMKDPTATHALAEGHDTAPSLFCGVVAFGLGTTDQAGAAAATPGTAATAGTAPAIPDTATPVATATAAVSRRRKTA